MSRFSTYVELEVESVSKSSRMKSATSPLPGLLTKLQAERAGSAAFMPLQRTNTRNARMERRSLEDRTLKGHECGVPSQLRQSPFNHFSFFVEWPSRSKRASVRARFSAPVSELMPLLSAAPLAEWLSLGRCGVWKHEFLRSWDSRFEIKSGRIGVYDR